MRALLCLAIVALITSCSDSVEAALVPISVVATTESSRLIVTAAIDDCADPTTDVTIEEGPSEVTVSVRFAAGDVCTYGGFFTDIDVQLDGPLGDRTLVLSQPAEYQRVVGNDVCIIDGDQQSPRCVVEGMTEAQ